MDKLKLIDAGVNYDEGLERFGGKTELYEKYLRKIFDLNLMDKLHTQLKNKDYDGAFRTAHDLKGTTGNLSMNEFYNSICKLVEELRSGTPDDKVTEMYKDALALYNKVKNAVGGD